MRVFVKTYGCQMNVRDSEVICGLLEKAGYKITDSADKADILLFNTCSVRQHAEDKVWSEVGRIAKSRKLGTVPLGRQSIAKAGTVPIIGIVGCMAQNYKEKIFDRAANVDFAVGPSDIAKIPAIIKSFFTDDGRRKTDDLLERKIWETDGEIRPEEIYHTGYHQDKEHAYVVISEGCSNTCSYCVVPYVRGPLRSRSHKDILKEIKEAIDKGITSITLLGQNVNAYRDAEVGFVELVGLVELIRDLEEFSFVTSHPKDTSLDLFTAMANIKKLKKYLHLPVQSGSDRILGLMNRGYTRKFYLDLVGNYRKIVKDGILTTDIIVGFPAETEGDFEDTYSLVRDIRFNAAYIFKYSPRPHTVAEKLADDVPRQEKEKRHRIILELQKKISRDKQC
jgi:tRNA-2-methylthio-N6-dimethylallyladenosine synthase